MLNIEKLESKEKLREVKITINYMKEKESLLTLCGFYSNALLWLGTVSALTLVPLPIPQHFFHNKTHPPRTFGLFCKPNAS